MKRPYFLSEIEAQFEVHPVCAILGPRQVGKTTLARMFIDEYLKDHAYFLDLEDPTDLAKLDNPKTLLSSITANIIVIDEIQRKPDLFTVLRVLVDRPNNKQKFLVLGSASQELIRQSSETLAGRIGYIELTPFGLNEVGNSEQLWVRGGFPRSFLAPSDNASLIWRQGYIKTFLEKDVPNLGFLVPPETLRRFWLMLAHYHAQIFNASELGNSFGASHHAVHRYLDILEGTFMIRILIPWIENLKKRQVRSPKIYFRDSGIFNALTDIADKEQLLSSARLGSSWEGFALEHAIRALHVPPEQCYFWATHAHAELDLLIFKGGKRLGFEVKFTESPRTSKSMHIAIEDLKLDHLGIIYPGKDIFPITDKITAYGLESIATGEFAKRF